MVQLHKHDHNADLEQYIQDKLQNLINTENTPHTIFTKFQAAPLIRWSTDYCLTTCPSDANQIHPKFHEQLNEQIWTKTYHSCQR